MSDIKILDISVANLIAAGEVVERPASALKELCENSIDAGAKNITVEIKRGGVALMRVTDDGRGMSAEDAVKCIERHATSKIRSASDLHAITTLGFRGEALAAITAVTHTRIMTKARGESAGTLVEVDYGKLTEVSEGGYPAGTTVICEQLFAHTPARLKFLKSDSSEGASCASTVEKLALSHPEVAFKFISDGAMKFQTTGGGNLKNTVYSVLGREFANKLVEVDSESGGIGVSGFVGTPDNVRGNRAMELFFINNRCVRSMQLMAAVEAAFKSFCPIGKFPVCVLNVSLGASHVDVNVHPSKLEVKFSDEKNVFDAVYYSVRGALERNLKNPIIEQAQNNAMTEEKLRIISAFAPVDEKPKHEQTSFSMSKHDDKQDKKEPRLDDFTLAKKSNLCDETERKESGYKIQSDKVPESSVKMAESYFTFRRGDGGYEKTIESTQTAKKIASPVDFGKKDDEYNSKTVNLDTDAALEGYCAKEMPEYRIIGEAFNCYVIVELDDRIVLIDKHAAHERINFEKMKANISNKKPDVQILLLDEKLPLSTEEVEMCSKYAKELSDVGYVFGVGESSVTLSGIPAGFEIAEGKELFCQLLTSLSDSLGAMNADRQDYFEKALYQSSCKASVKAGRRYDEAHIRWIVENVFRYDCIKRCPHGRPVAIEMSKHELDTRFGRIK
ncbi:MAG: DNA mismatch repair endonuclease MutL [Clostridia bacterium]|nr:DNA mismatch repair endonuclease MutL [Clostridia bacterium]